jgi:thiol-disulfide isomerase/thioredoxin
MKKILIIIFTLISFNCFAVEKTTTFTKEIFNKAQSEGKIVVVNSWNKFCYTCKKQTKILDQAKNEFKDVLFLSFEQKKNKEIADLLKIDYWTTIVIYKDNIEIHRSIGETDKLEIYLAIQKGV